MPPQSPPTSASPSSTPGASGHPAGARSTAKGASTGKDPDAATLSPEKPLRNHPSLAGSLRSCFFLHLLTALADAAWIGVSFYLAHYIRFQWPAFVEVFPIEKGIVPWSVYYDALRTMVPIWILLFYYACRFYRDRFLPVADELLMTAKGCLLGLLVASLQSYILRNISYSRLVLLLAFPLCTAGIFLLHQGFKLLDRKLLHLFSAPKKVLLLGGGKIARLLRERLAQRPGLSVLVRGDLMSSKDLEEILLRERVQEVYLAQSPILHELIVSSVEVCEALGVKFKLVPDLLELRMGEFQIEDSLGIPTLELGHASLSGAKFWVKRGFDLMAGSLILAVLALPLAILSAWILLDSKGGVFHRQRRVGHRGRVFHSYKFRTMAADAENRLESIKHLSIRSGPVFKMKEDPRVTRAGRFLRRFSLDELPQIFNVLRGEMSLVGPRPQVTWEAEAYDASARRRLHILPGITGLWQVSGRADLSYEEMIALDLYYVEHWSLGMDLGILLKTIPAVISGKGAY
ncbi:MAG: sugar transferase [Elusimicrobia bacterium]|nr:sugar transferase [Elusimicrobiota bacterium]